MENSVKRIIAGQTYNTDTAILVAESEEAHPQSLAWWALYQTRHGAFFRITVDHHGNEDEFSPLTDTEAQAFLEKHPHTNHLVEQYFGPMPEGGAAERRLTIRIPGNLADRLQAAAQAKGLSLNSYAMRCFERCAASDGQPSGKS